MEWKRNEEVNGQSSTNAKLKTWKPTRKNFTKLRASDGNIISLNFLCCSLLGFADFSQRMQANMLLSETGQAKIRRTFVASLCTIFKLNLPLLNNDPKLMKEFTNWMTWSDLNCWVKVINWVEPLNKSPTELIALVVMEVYHHPNVERESLK
jgi:hypothetical protein